MFYLGVFFLSDHDFLALDFQLANSPASGHGVWKFNTSLLMNSTLPGLGNSRIRVFC